MATVAPERPRNLQQDHQKVRSPLSRLRSYIWTYVCVEGVAVAILFMVVAFWVSLLLDYGTFKALTLDWVQLMRWGWGTIFLTVLAAGVVAILVRKILLRLFKEFREPTLAMVLEQRFPELLGDRLITAVELSDPEKAAELGYSPSMVRQTIHEAAERVDQIPVGDVLDWRRLVKQGAWIGVLTLLLGGAATGGFAALASMNQGKSAMAGVHQFGDVLSIWFERNVMLKYTPWPRRAHLVILEPKADPLRIGESDPDPVIRVRAVKYVLADADTHEGWRPLMIRDLEERPDLLGGARAEPPGDWASRYHADGLSVDEMELFWKRMPVKLSAGTNPGGKWLYYDANLSDWRPMLWKDLTPEGLGGVNPPQLSADWDYRAEPLLAAQCVAMLGGTGHVSWGASQALLPGSQLTDHVTVDEVEKLLATEKFKDVKLAVFPRAGRLPDFATSAVGLMTPDGGMVGAATGAALISGVTEINLSADIRHVLDRLARLNEVREMLDRLDQRIDDPSMSRTMRRLIVPQTVELAYTVQGNTHRVTLNINADNEYSNWLKDLQPGKEEYWVKGEDFKTPDREVEKLPAPAFTSLMLEQAQPSYLYYRPTEGLSALELSELRQQIDPIEIVNPGTVGLSKKIIPARTDVVLRGKVNRPVSEVKIRYGEAGIPEKLEEGVEGDSVTLKFPEVTRDIDFTLEFKDQDGVIGYHRVVIEVDQDDSPQCDFAPDPLIRQARAESRYAGRYMVTVRARIPFAGNLKSIENRSSLGAKDKHGLSYVRYAYTLKKVGYGPSISGPTLSIFASAPLLASLRGEVLGAASMYWTGVRLGTAEVEMEAASLTTEYTPTLPSFNDQMREKEGALLSDESIQEMVGQKKPESYRELLKEFALIPDPWESPTDPVRGDFSVGGLDLTVKSEREVQPHYLMQLWLEAGDTDLQTLKDSQGRPIPKVTPSVNRYPFVIVSENELISEIARDEEGLRAKLKQLVDQPDNLWTDPALIHLEAELVKEHLDLVSSDVKAEYLAGMSNRIGETHKVLLKGRTFTYDVVEEYKRLLREMQINVVNAQYISKVKDTIVDPLSEIEQELFPDTAAAVNRFRQNVAAAKDLTGDAFTRAVESARESGVDARTKMRELKAAFDNVLQAMQKLTDINKLVEQLRMIEENERQQLNIIKTIHSDLEKKLLDELLKGAGTLP